MLIISYWAHQKVGFFSKLLVKNRQKYVFSPHYILKTQFFSSNLLNMKKIWGGGRGIELQGSTRTESIKRLHTTGAEEGNRKPDTVAA